MNPYILTYRLNMNSAALALKKPTKADKPKKNKPN